METSRVIINLPYKLRKDLNADEIEKYFLDKKKKAKLLNIIMGLLTVAMVVVFLFVKIPFVTPIYIFSQLLIIIFLMYNNYKSTDFSKEEIASDVKSYKDIKGQ